MDDIVAIRVDTSSGASAWFLTYGRIQDPVDPGPLERLVRRYARACLLPGAPTRATVCRTIGEAGTAPWFFEGLLWFAWSPVPFGKGHRRWRKREARRMAKGRDIFFLGVTELPAG